MIYTQITFNIHSSSNSLTRRDEKFIQNLVFFQAFRHIYIQAGKTGNFYTFVISNNQSCISHVLNVVNPWEKSLNFSIHWDFISRSNFDHETSKIKLYLELLNDIWKSKNCHIVGKQQQSENFVHRIFERIFKMLSTQRGNRLLGLLHMYFQPISCN